jgi:hypothetical protein
MWDKHLFFIHLQTTPTDTPPSQPTVPEVVVKDVCAGSGCGSEDRNLIGDASEVFEQQTLDLKRLHIAGNN